jgi:Winged helix DNA-binding domain
VKTRRLVRSLRGAAAFVDRVGIALLFPKDDLILPSLWEAVAGSERVEWATRDDEERFVEFSPNFDRVWRWKDELPEKRLACVGKHLRGRSVLISLKALPALYALTGRTGKPTDFRKQDDLSPMERDVAEFVYREGPVSAAVVRRAFSGGPKRPSSVIDALEKLLILTRAGNEEQEQGWAAAMLDVLPRRYREHLRRLPKPDDARVHLAGCVLGGAGELSVADLTGAMGWRKAEATATLDSLVGKGSATVTPDDGIAIYRPR